MARIIGPYKLDFEAWADEHLYWFFLSLGKNVIILSGDVHYAFTSTAKVTRFDHETLRNAARQYPDLPTGRSGSPTYNPVAVSRFLQLNSSALKNYANDYAVGVPASVTAPRGILVSTDGLSRAGYKDGKFTIENDLGGRPGTAASLKPHPSCSPAAPPSNRRPCVLLQQIAERLLGKLLKCFLGLAREQVERVPSLRIELDQLSAGLCRLLGHEKPPLERGAPGLHPVPKTPS
jgi:hypothetical protein